MSWPAPVARIGPFRLVGRWHNHDPGHHAPVLVLEDVAVIDELAELAERYLLNDRGRDAMALAPLRRQADAVLIVVDLVGDGRVRHCYAQGKVVLDNLALARADLLDEPRLVQVKVVVLGRQLNQLP